MRTKVNPDTGQLEIRTGPESFDTPQITNETDKTLSGTPKIFIVKDSTGAEYYIKGYPTKA